MPAVSFGITHQHLSRSRRRAALSQTPAHKDKNHISPDGARPDSDICSVLPATSLRMGLSSGWLNQFAQRPASAAIGFGDMISLVCLFFSLLLFLEVSGEKKKDKGEEPGDSFFPSIL